jgi:hypothetical protein
MSTAQISLQARSSSESSGLILDFWFDDERVSSMTLTPESQEFRHEFPDVDDREHCFEIELRGKTPDHTKINDQGAIVQDVVAEIVDVALDDIQLGHMFLEKTQYHHDHNGTTDPVQDQFFGSMGCNGRVKLRFTSPVYLWLLEHM